MAAFRPRGTAALATLAVVIAAGAWPRTASAQMTIPVSGQVPNEPVTRSLLLGEDRDQIRAWWAQPVNDLQAGWKNTINSYANRTLGGEPTNFDESVRHAATAQAAAFRWAMEGRAEDLDKAVQALVTMKVYETNDLTESEIVVNFLHAYDFIRNAEIDPADRAEIERRCLNAARAIGDFAFFDPMNNWLAKRAGARGLAGVMLRDQPLLDSALLRLNQSFDVTTTDDGWYTDSQGHYLNYIFPSVIPFLRAYEQGSGVDLWPNIEPFVTMSHGLRMPDGLIPNVQDGLNTNVATFLFSRGISDPFAEETIEYLVNGPQEWGNVQNNDYTTIDFFYTADFTRSPRRPDRSPTWFSPGQAKMTVFRHDWTAASDYFMLSPGVDGKPDFLGLSQGHCHNDTGEFILFTRGEPVIVAPGYDRDDLSNSPPGFNPRRASWHNVILVDGQIGDGDLTRPEDFQHRDRLDSTEFGAFAGVCDHAALEYAYRGTDIRRTVAWPLERYFVVADLARASAARDLTFNIVGRGQLTVLADEPNRKNVAWEVGDAKVVHHLLANRGMSLATDSIWMHKTWNTYEPTQRVQATARTESVAFLSILEPTDAGIPGQLQVENLSGTVHAAATVTNADEGWQDTLLAQPSGTMRRAGGFASDGAFALVHLSLDTYDPQAVMIARATMLSRATGEVILATSAPLTISVAYARDVLAATISSDDFLPGTQVHFAGLNAASDVLLNGAAAPFEVTSAGLTITLSEPGELRVSHLPPLDLHAPDLVAGEVAEFIVEGAEPGEGVTLAYSTRGFGFTPVDALLAALDLDRPTAAGRMTADIEGVARLERAIPPTARGLTVYVQAVARGRTSDPAVRLVE